MRTKTLLLTAALVAAGVATSMAQTSNVYSLNVVGYVNVTLSPGFNMIANPLDADGSGTNNTLNSAFGGTTALPNLAKVYKFSGGTFGNASSYLNGSWFPNQTFNPGEGVFIQNPASTNVTITFVGQVLQGTETNSFPSGFSIISSKFPLGGGLGTGVGFTNGVANLDKVYTFNPATQTYGNASSYLNGSWFPEPTIAVGQSFFLSSAAGGAWVKTFNVQ